MQVDRKKNTDKTNNTMLDLIQKCWLPSLAVQEKAAIENLIPCNTTKGEKESIFWNWSPISKLQGGAWWS